MEFKEGTLEELLEAHPNLVVLREGTGEVIVRDSSREIGVSDTVIAAASLQDENFPRVFISHPTEGVISLSPTANGQTTVYVEKATSAPSQLVETAKIGMAIFKSFLNTPSGKRDKFRNRVVDELPHYQPRDYARLMPFGEVAQPTTELIAEAQKLGLDLADASPGLHARVRYMDKILARPIIYPSPPGS